MLLRPVIPFAFLLAVLLSCARESSPVQEPEESRVSVSFLALGDGTKASGVTGHESDVSTVDVLVFRSGSGVLDCSARSASPSVSVSVPRGIALSWHVFANAPEGVFDGIRTESELLSARTLLAHNGESGLVMHGSGTGSFDVPVPADVEVPLSRYACKVSLGRIVPSFVAGEVNEVRFRGAFLLNVCGDEPWSGAATAGSVWYNRQTRDKGLPAPVAGFVATDADTLLTDASAFDAEYSFYCMPNPISDGAKGSGVTRLVLAFSVGGNTDYYPIDIPSMESNRWYCIDSVSLLGPGSSDPDTPVSRTELSFTIEVTPWGTPVPTGNVEFDE